MVTEAFSALLHQVGNLGHQFQAGVDVGFLIFGRLLGFSLVAPVFGRKDIPFAIRLNIALLLTFVMLWHRGLGAGHLDQMHSESIWYVVQLMINVTIGYIIGFLADVIMQAVGAAGAMINNQIGLSSAIFFDPGSRQQVALLEKLFSLMGLVIFFNIGGMYWLISALDRSFEIFPLYSLRPDIVGQISLDYIVQVTGNVLVIGTQLMAPVLLVTMAVDIILGIVNRTAQQIQVFQLSFGLKPSIGMGAFLLTLPIFIQLVQHYLSDYAQIF